MKYALNLCTRFPSENEFTIQIFLGNLFSTLIMTVYIQLHCYPATFLLVVALALSPLPLRLGADGEKFTFL